MKTKTAGIRRIVKGQHVVDGAGVSINRIIGSQRLGHIDPFVLLDEIRSDNPGDYIAGFPTHPHRGIETITYMVHGSFRHKDSRGNGGLLTDGCVQWMTAGRGILHSEMPEETEGTLWGYQLWLSLPARDKMTEPGYQHLSPDMIPVAEENGLTVKVISGDYGGAFGPAANYVKTSYFDVDLDRGQIFGFDVDRDMNCFCYVHTGSVIIGDAEGEPVRSGNLIEFDRGSRIEVLGNSDRAGFLLLAGYPNDEPIVRGGPFVMNSEEEIRQAFEDYRNGDLR